MNIYTIAKIAGVSTATVSMVINGREGIGEETRKKILQIMKESNFKPRLTNNSSDTVGIFLRFNQPDPLTNSYISRILEGICHVSYSYGYNIMIIPIEKIPKDRDEFKLYCMKRRINSAIFMYLTDSDRYVLNYEGLFPIVTISSKFNSDKIISARSKNKEGAYEIVKYLIEMGHRKIAFMVADLSVQDHRERLEGYKQALLESGIEIDDNLIINYVGCSDTDLTIIIDKLFISQDDRPSAIFIFNDDEVIRISSFLEKLGIKICEDVSIVGFDDSTISAHFSPPLTTVRQPLFEMGRNAMQIIADILSNNVKEAVTDIIMDTKLIIRKSVLDLRERA